MGRLDRRPKFVGVGSLLVPAPGLTRAPVPPPVVGDAAEAVGRQVQHLRLPAVRVERPTVAEHHGATRSPILVMDARSVARGDSRHSVLLRVVAFQTTTRCTSAALSASAK